MEIHSPLPARSLRRWITALSGMALLLPTLLAGATASAANTRPPASEPWPRCDAERTMWCIETFAVDGADVPADSDWKLDVSTLDGGNGVYSVNWYLQNVGPDAGPNLTPPPDATSSQVEVVLNTGDLVPRFTMGYGTGTGDQPFALHTGGNDTTGYTLHAIGFPLVVERMDDPACQAGDCGDETTHADVAIAAFGGNTQDLATWGDDLARFDGMWIVTDAQYSTLPMFGTWPEPTWYLDLGNPHLGVDGVTPQVGEFTARVPAGMLESVGATADDAVSAGLQTHRVRDDLVVEVPSTVTLSRDEGGQPDGGVILHITEFPYSVATLQVGGTVVPDDPGDGGGPPEVTPSLTRLAGDDRILTGIAVSERRFPDAGSAQTAVLARSDLFPDALAGTPLAAARGGPLLLTSPTALDPRVLAEVERVLPSGATVYLLGGNAALAPAVQAAVEAAGYDAVRLQGETRYDTAAAIGLLLAEDAGRIYLATGRNFPDALGAGAAAAATGGIVLLTDDTTLPAATRDVIEVFATDTPRIAVGGQAAAADPEATEAVGADRYETSRLLATLAFDGPTVFGLASGVNFPDGLTGGAQVGALGGPLLLVRPDAVPATVASYLDATTSLRTGYLYGGAVAVNGAVFDAVEATILGR